MKETKATTSYQIEHLDPEVVVNWTCPECGKKCRTHRRIPLLQRDMGFLNTSCGKCKSKVEVHFKIDKIRYK